MAPLRLSSGATLPADIVSSPASASTCDKCPDSAGGGDPFAVTCACSAGKKSIECEMNCSGQIVAGPWIKCTLCRLLTCAEMPCVHPRWSTVPWEMLRDVLISTTPRIRTQPNVSVRVRISVTLLFSKMPRLQQVEALLHLQSSPFSLQSLIFPCRRVQS